MGAGVSSHEMMAACHSHGFGVDTDDYQMEKESLLPQQGMAAGHPGAYQERSPMAHVSSQGSTLPRNEMGQHQMSVSGRWVGSAGGLHVVDKHSVFWSDGNVSKLRIFALPNGSCAFATTVQGFNYQGELGADGMLHWSDGDTWVRPGIHVEEPHHTCALSGTIGALLSGVAEVVTSPCAYLYAYHGEQHLAGSVVEDYKDLRQTNSSAHALPRPPSAGPWSSQKQQPEEHPHRPPLVEGSATPMRSWAQESPFGEHGPQHSQTQSDLHQRPALLSVAPNSAVDLAPHFAPKPGFAAAREVSRTDSFHSRPGPTANSGRAPLEQYPPAQPATSSSWLSGRRPSSTMATPLPSVPSLPLSMLSERPPPPVADSRRASALVPPAAAQASKREETSPPSSPAPWSARASEDGRPDFSGRWKCVATEGDVETFLETLGDKQFNRFTAMAEGYAVHGSVRCIEQAGHEFTVSVEGFNKRRMSLKIGGVPKRVDLLQGTVIVQADWEGTMLRCSFTTTDGDVRPAHRYYFQGDTLVLEVSGLAGGGTAKFLLQRV